MTNSDHVLKHGDEYIVFYTGGPYDGRTDTRISTDGSWDEELTVLALEEGKETQVVYGSPVVREVGDQVQVTYAWDADDSETADDTRNHDLEE
jgi:hypothetical protein